MPNKQRKNSRTQNREAEAASADEEAHSPAPSDRLSAQDLLLQQMQAQMAQQAAMMAKLKEKMESMQVSRAGSPASSVQVNESQAKLDENADRSHPQAISRIVKDKIPVFKPMANLDRFDRAQMCHSSNAGLSLRSSLETRGRHRYSSHPVCS